AARRLQDQVHAGLLGERAARAEGGDRAVDEARVERSERLVAEAVALHDAGAEVLDQHVRRCHQPADQRGARLLADVDREPALVAVQALEVEAADLGREAAGAVGVADAVAAPRLLHLDDVGAQVAEPRRAPRADPEIRCAVLTGAGERVFSAGMDMKTTIPAAQRFARGERIEPEAFEGLRSVATALLAGFDLATPLVCAVNGHSRAGGFDLMLA